MQGLSWQRLIDDYRLCVAMGVYVAVEYCRGGVNERWISVWLTMLQRSLARATIWTPRCGRSPMNILISTFGVRGDVQPYLALAVGLQHAGHCVTRVPNPYRS